MLCGKGLAVSLLLNSKTRCQSEQDFGDTCPEILYREDILRRVAEFKMSLKQTTEKKNRD